MLLPQYSFRSDTDPLPDSSRYIRGRFGFDNVVLQPTTRCNLNCSYCYLPHRRQKTVMNSGVAQRVAETLGHHPRHVSITWHGGEPLTCGTPHFTKLLEPFEPLRNAGRLCHIVQTNATLIDGRWCELFRAYGFHVGVSIDGDAAFNDQRVTWSGRQSFSEATRGIASLRKEGIAFSAIAVVRHETLSRAREFFEFFTELGCFSLGINIVEKVNACKDGCSATDELVKSFWSELFQCWRQSPKMQIREFTHAFSWFSAVLSNSDAQINERAVDLFPTIDVDGNVVLLSPEFSNAQAPEHNNFVVGNVLETPLDEIISSAMNVAYVREYLGGRKLCESSCEYYTACGGGNAAHKYFALGTMYGTETPTCRFSDKLMIDALVDLL